VTFPAFSFGGASGTNPSVNLFASKSTEPAAGGIKFGAPTAPVQAPKFDFGAALGSTANNGFSFTGSTVKPPTDGSSRKSTLYSSVHYV
jgi:hypothetical protein